MLVSMDIYGNMTLENAVYTEFVEGNEPGPNHRQLLDSIEWLKLNELRNGSRSFT